MCFRDIEQHLPPRFFIQRGDARVAEAYSLWAMIGKKIERLGGSFVGHGGSPQGSGSSELIAIRD
jgi:hypothetical protein